MEAEIVRRGGRLYGPLEPAHNIVSHWSGTIHDDDRARELGFRGAMVSGRVHLNVFVPVLLDAFGSSWFEHGTLSVDFREATLDGEPVRAVVDEPARGADVQARAILEDRDGTVVAEGTVGMGRPEDATWLGARDLEAHDEEPYELVSAVRPGDDFPVTTGRLTRNHAEMMARGAAPIPWYLESSPWGSPIASPALMVNALGRACGTYLRDHPVRGVPIDGATELRNIGGPIFLDRRYTIGGSVVARGQSPRTEYFWYRAWLDDEDGERIAEMLLQWRSVKGS